MDANTYPIHIETYEPLGDGWQQIDDPDHLPPKRKVIEVSVKAWGTFFYMKVKWFYQRSTKTAWWRDTEPTRDADGNIEGYQLYPLDEFDCWREVATPEEG